MNRKKALLIIGILMVGILLTTQVSLGAVPPAVGTVIDDFEDGDSSDWGFFGGNNAGGGGGVLADRPYEGAFISAPAGAARGRPAASTAERSRTSTTPPR